MRNVTIASISAEMIASGLEISDTDIETAFEGRIDEFGTPERRNIRKMVFDATNKAKTALSRLDAGEKFNAVAADMLNWTEDDTKLGFVSKSALDPAPAEIAFSINSIVRRDRSKQLLGSMSLSLIKSTRPVDRLCWLI